LSVRAFVSVDIEEPELLKALENAQRRLEETEADLKSVERENIHFTMMFLGNIDERRLSQLKKIISNLAFETFIAELEGLGAFPNVMRPRTIWAGITRGADQLGSIYGRLSPEISSMGIRLDDRGFNPHITLARVRSGRNRDLLIKELTAAKEEHFGDMIVKRIRLKGSTLTREGPIYVTFAESKEPK